MANETAASEKAEETIKEIFKGAEAVAALHACLSSCRGDNFRLHLLQALEMPLDESAIERFRIGARINEYHRHLNRLLEFGLVRLDRVNDQQHYIRTKLAEQAINAVRGLERRLGKEAAQAVSSASLGTNSIRLFLKIYGDQKEADWEHLRIRYTREEIGRLSLFLPRVIEGVSAVDKLHEAGLLVYKEDDHIHMQPVKARSVYQYLHDIIRADLSEIDPPVSRADTIDLPSTA